MNQEYATFGRSGMYPNTDEGFRRALDAGHRMMVWLEVDMAWRAPICLDDYDSRTLWLRGVGQLGTNVHRDFEGEEPCLYALDTEWRMHDHGVNWLGKEDPATGHPVADDALTPIIRLSLLDRSSFKDMGFYACTAVLGGPCGIGRVSLTTFDSVEVHRSMYEGLDLCGARNITFQGRCSIERNGLKAPELYAGLSITCDGPDRDSIDIRGHAFEHDDPRHVALVVRGAQAAHIGGNRFNQCGQDVEADYSDFFRDIVIGPGMMRRAGTGNRWHGRGQQLAGPFFNRRLELEPESAFDFRVNR